VEQLQRTPTMNTQTKIETFILSKIKSLGPININSTYGDGELIIKNVRVETLYINNLPYRLHLDVVYHGTTNKCRWESPQYAGRRRNQEIRSKIQWQQNDIKFLAKVFGIKNIEVNKITVKKK
jgi:hypothetical protein